MVITRYVLCNDFVGFFYALIAYKTGGEMNDHQKSELYNKTTHICYYAYKMHSYNWCFSDTLKKKLIRNREVV